MMTVIARRCGGNSDDVLVIVVDDAGAAVAIDNTKVHEFFGTRLGYRGIARRWFHPDAFTIEKLDAADPRAAQAQHLPPLRDDALVDLRQVASPALVAHHGDDAVEAVAAVADAHCFVESVIAVSGASVLTMNGRMMGRADCPLTQFLNGSGSDDAWGRATELLDAGSTFADAIAAVRPAHTSLPPLGVVSVSELDDLVVALASIDEPNCTRDALLRALASWCELVEDSVDCGLLDETVIRRPFYRREANFEKWMIASTPTLIDGVTLQVIHSQWRTPVGTIADVVAKVVNSSVEGFAVGDIVVIENKATEAVPRDIDQLAGYLPHAANLAGVEGSRVHGILAAPGIGHRAALDADALGITAVSWGELGYFDYLWIGDANVTPMRDWIRTR